jgi:telomeric repeat-binding factor 2-interacting protein 1
VPERATSVTRGSHDRSSKVVTRPREPPGPVTETSVSDPDHDRHQNLSIPATRTTAAEINPPKQTVDLLFQQFPFYPSSSEPETVDGEVEEEDDEEDSDSEENSNISSWVQAQVAKGAEISTVLDALRYTSMEPVLAKKLLKILVAGEPVPDNMRGVWTEEDDRCLRSQDARDVERVTKKHGDRLFQARWEYLEMARERGLVQ